MDKTHLLIVVGMGLVTYISRLAPQLLMPGRNFPEALDRYFRYLSYALVVSVISVNLFISGARFEAGAAPQRSFALLSAIVVALITKSSLIGMLAGTAIVLVLSWPR
ncbi:MAG: AzlD domain-containing protein [Deltaproteobacteria bacterium]|nr:AzlD domain-containing protein [Deltaproteobacteria bacterium]